LIHNKNSEAENIASCSF